MENTKEVINHTAETVISKRRGTKKERWITERTWKSINERRTLKGKESKWPAPEETLQRLLKNIDSKTRASRSTVKRTSSNGSARKPVKQRKQQKWVTQKYSYQIVKELAGNNSRPLIKQKDGKYATTHDEQIILWQEHFSSVLNSTEPEMLHDFKDDIQEQDIPTLDVNEGPMTEAEVIRAIKHLKNGKAAGTDGIQPELLKHAELIAPRLMNLFNGNGRTKRYQQSGEMV